MFSFNDIFTTAKQPEQQGTGAVTDENGRTLGLEDPNDPALVDDPEVFNSSIPIVAVPPPTGEPSKNLVDSRGKPYIDPRAYGGRSIDETSPGQGEPLNVIVSAQSSPEILTRKGLQGYLRSIDLDMECLGLHSGTPQKAWLDPRGWVDQNFLYREVYTPFDHVFGTCVESLRGGNHVRAWQQAGTGAWFFAASKEENVTQHHMIIPDGYNIGRDWIVQQSQRNKNGVTSFMFKHYQTQVEYVTDLMSAGTDGINHGIATDGKTALITIKILSSDDKSALKLAQKQKSPESKRKSFVPKLSKKDKKERPTSNVAQPSAQIPVPASA